MKDATHLHSAPLFIILAYNLLSLPPTIIYWLFATRASYFSHHEATQAIGVCLCCYRPSPSSCCAPKAPRRVVAIAIITFIITFQSFAFILLMVLVGFCVEISCVWSGRAAERAQPHHLILLASTRLPHQS